MGFRDLSRPESRFGRCPFDRQRLSGNFTGDPHKFSLRVLHGSIEVDQVTSSALPPAPQIAWRHCPVDLYRIKIAGWPADPASPRLSPSRRRFPAWHLLHVTLTGSAHRSTGVLPGGDSSDAMSLAVLVISSPGRSLMTAVADHPSGLTSRSRTARLDVAVGAPQSASGYDPATHRSARPFHPRQSDASTRKNFTRSSNSIA